MQQRRACPHAALRCGVQTLGIGMWSDGERELKTRGVDSNQVMAAVKATLRMINIRMHTNAPK